MRAVALIFCLLLATACDEKSPTGSTVPLNEQLRITLVELQPYPFSTRTIADSEYRATFMATRP